MESPEFFLGFGVLRFEFGLRAKGGLRRCPRHRIRINRSSLQAPGWQPDKPEKNQAAAADQENRKTG